MDTKGGCMIDHRLSDDANELSSESHAILRK